jgi:hypothetical protein
MKLQCCFLSLIFSGGLFAQQSDTLQQTNNIPTYEQMRKSGRTLTFVGGAGIISGLVLWTIAGSKAANQIGNVFTLQPVDESSGEVEAIFGTILFVGGTAAFITGISKSSKARRMLEAGTISFQPYAPPMRVTPKAIIPQTGFTIGIPIRR